jgi:hypothetical protein
VYSKIQKATQWIRIEIFTHQSAITLQYLREFSLQLISTYVCAVLCFVLSTQKIQNEFQHKSGEKNRVDFKTKVRRISVYIKQNLCQNVRRTIIVCHYDHCAKGKKEQRQFTYRLLSIVTEIETKMLLSDLLGLIAQLSLIADNCDIETSEETSIDWNQVGIGLW